MTTILRARSLPYRPQLRADNRICTRCGIRFTINTTRDAGRVMCRDCREAMS